MRVLFLRKRLGRLPWWLVLLHALACGALAVFLHLAILEEYRDRALSAAGDAPPPIDLRMFKPDRDIHVAGEVNVTGQLDRSQIFQMDPGQGTAFYVVGLLGTTDGAGSVPRAGLVLNEESFGNLDGFQKSRFLSNGLVGPRIRLGGTILNNREVRGAIASQLAQEGKTLPRSFQLIIPFTMPRYVALAPAPSLWWLVPLLPLVLMVVLFRLAYGNWSTTPLGMYAALKARQRWRRWMRRARLKPLSPARAGHTVLFNPFRWARALFLLRTVVRHTALGCNARLRAWLDRKTARKLNPQDPFARFGTQADAPPARREDPDMMQAIKLRRAG